MVLWLLFGYCHFVAKMCCAMFPREWNSDRWFENAFKFQPSDWEISTTIVRNRSLRCTSGEHNMQFSLSRIASEISSIFNHIRFPNLKNLNRQPSAGTRSRLSLDFVNVIATHTCAEWPRRSARSRESNRFKYNYNESITSPHLWLLCFIERCAFCELNSVIWTV